MYKTPFQSHTRKKNDSKFNKSLARISYFLEKKEEQGKHICINIFKVTVHNIDSLIQVFAGRSTQVKYLDRVANIDILVIQGLMKKAPTSNSNLPGVPSQRAEQKANISQPNHRANQGVIFTANVELP
ncbi:unnamed protein product [Acanthoscelides obtectus]|uniref:Uncharacterized protein n=1 Tax=Acanthoscelides obtectus TaxID=200917 RepID=A0A9P0Q6L9_ACAOB|nr:unnamed protein product [Acanthoscelides obtectus]CAK1677770.1 hypothetical protein AOBTE_LOCUS31544 [Acanthoscelides obtectus]